MLEILKIGRKRANKYTDGTSSVNFAACDPCENLAVCEDKFSGAVAAARSIKSVNFADTVYTPDSPISVSDTTAITAWLCQVFQKEEFNVLAEVTYDGTDLMVRHVGAMTLAEITLDDDTVLTTVRCCEVKSVIKWVLYLEGTIDDLTHGGNTATLANNPYTYTGTLATDEATATQLQTDFEAALTALGVPFLSVTVNVDTVSEMFYVEYMSTEQTSVASGVNTFNNCGYSAQFMC